MTTAPAPQATEPTGYPLEQGQRFSRSILWKLTRDFYHQKGLGAWDTGTVPSYVTSNPYIAQTYANIVMTFLKDCLAPPAEGAAEGTAVIDPAHPIYIVELAAGHARFSYLFLKKFFALKDRSKLKALDVRFVMTDFTETNVRSWEQQPLFKEFLDRGVLEFALFDLENDSAIRLVRGGGKLSKSTVKNPMVVLGNYIFDTLTSDYFRVENGRINEGLITTRGPASHEPDLSVPEIMSQFNINFEYRPLTSPDYYEDALYNQILAGYGQRLTDTTVVFPVGPLSALRRLLDISSNRLFVLSSDKGYTHEDELFYLSGQHIQFHGSISLMVNYHAMGQLIQGLGGHYMATAQRQLNLKTVGFIVGGDQERFSETMQQFSERADIFGPYDYYMLINNIRTSCQNLSVEGCMELIRMSHWDPQVFFEFGKVLLEQAGNMNDSQRAEVVYVMERVWENFFPLGKDLPFELARIYLALKRPREALRLNELSIQMFGEHPVTFSNMGICYYHAEDLQSAIRCFKKSLSLNSDYGLPRAWLSRVEAEQARKH